jgi:hypothetical protein
MKHVIAAICLCALSGCALPGRPVAGLFAADIAGAQAIAKAGGDTQGAACWGALLPAVQALRAGQSPAAASALEIERVAVRAAEGPCAPIVLPILIRLAPALAAADLLTAAGPLVIP